jgi:hypothetical protein
VTESNRGKDNRAPLNGEREPSFPVVLFSGLAILWAALQGLWTVIVLQADPSNVCDAPQPELAVAAGLTLLLALAAFIFAIAGRNDRTAVALLVAVAASVAWLALGGMPATACVIE